MAVQKMAAACRRTVSFCGFIDSRLACFRRLLRRQLRTYAPPTGNLRFLHRQPGSLEHRNPRLRNVFRPPIPIRPRFPGLHYYYC